MSDAIRTDGGLREGTPTRGAGLALLCVREPLDLAGARELRRRIHALTRRCTWLVVDLHGCRFMDGFGVRMLMEAAEVLRARGGELRLVAPASGPVARVLSLVGWRARFGVFSSVTDACRDWGRVRPTSDA